MEAAMKKKEKPIHNDPRYINTRIERETYTRFRIVCMAKGVKPQEQVIKIMDAWIAKNSKILKDI